MASAADECPNVVFRTGPSAKLPECRAYELVSPSYTGGVPPQMNNVFNWMGAFAFPLITDDGNSVTYQSLAGALPGFPGSGYNDRYEAKRTANGWQTEFTGVAGSDGAEAWLGRSSPDHRYYFTDIGGSNTKLEPESPYIAPFGGESADFLRKPDGNFELIGRGSLGESQHATGHIITNNASHVIFSTDTKLEPQAAPNGTRSVYDRTPGGPTHVVSLLPGDESTTLNARYQGSSSDGSEIAFGTSSGERISRLFVRVDNTTTQEVARADEVDVGAELECTGGPGSATLSYQWLSNGTPIGGATSSTYTAVAGDSGKVLQCQVTATNVEGGSVTTSLGKLVTPRPSTTPPGREGGAPSVSGIRNVGQTLTCNPGAWTGSPTFAYRWFRNGTEIGGATASTYTLVGADEGTGIQCRVSATNGGGTSVGHSPRVVIESLAPTATANPQISNVTDPFVAPAVGDELSCSEGVWTNSPAFSYQWLRAGNPIAGATSSDYTVVAEDEGLTLQCRVEGTNADATAQAVSAPVVVDPQPAFATPVQTTAGNVSGFATVGGSLFCTAGSWTGSPNFGFQWLRNGVEIATATEPSYTVTSADRETTLQCRVTATNASGVAVAINADSGAVYIDPSPPEATATLPLGGLAFGGIRNGNVFYADGPMSGSLQTPADLFSFDTTSQTTTRITDVGDALFVNVSDDGSSVYFISESQIGGEGVNGEPNLYRWTRGDGATTYVTTVDPTDLAEPKSGGQSQSTALAQWAYAVGPEQEIQSAGLGVALSRATPDGSVLVFGSRAQLSSFDNTAQSLGECGAPLEALETLKCLEIYRYDSADDDLSCLSCPSSSAPPVGEASFQSYGFGFAKARPLTKLTPPRNLTTDGNTVFFETPESLLPQDGNDAGDVYRWKEGDGLALISTGQAITDSYLYSMTPDGSDVLIVTGEQLRPEDENGGTAAIYDARVGGGFPPPEKTVTEPCSGDSCQGSPAPAPADPVVASASLAGTGNVTSKPLTRCGKGKKAVRRKGRTRCVAKKRNQKKHRRAGSNRRAGR